MLWLDSDSYFTGHLVSRGNWPQEFGLLYYGMLVDATAMKWKLSKLLATYEKSHNKALRPIDGKPAPTYNIYNQGSVGSVGVTSISLTFGGLVSTQVRDGPTLHLAAPRLKGGVEEDFAVTMQRRNAVFGYTHVGREEPREGSSAGNVFSCQPS